MRTTKGNVRGERKPRPSCAKQPCLQIPRALKSWAESSAYDQGITLSRYIRSLIETDREDWMEQLQKSRGMEYLTTIPVSVPEGRVVVHNGVPPTRRLGSHAFRAFRAWLESPSDTLEVCPCGWASELGEHYRLTADACSPDHWPPERDRRRGSKK